MTAILSIRKTDNGFGLGNREQEAPPGTQGVGSERETYCDGSDGKRSTGFKRWSAPQNGDGRAQNPIQFAVANQAPQGDGPPHQRAPPHPLTFVDLGDASEDGESVQTPLPEDKESDSEPESERFAGQPRDEDTEVGARVERNVEESKSGAETLQESGDDDAGELEDEEREREGEGEGEVKSERRFYFFDFTKICDNLYPPDVTTKMLKDFGLRYYPMRFREDEKIREIEALFREVLSFSRPKNVPEIPIVPFDFLRSQRYFTEMAQRPAARKSASARSSQSTAAGTSHPAAQLWAALIAQRARAFRRECSIRIENQGIDLADSFTADQLDYKPVHRGRSRDVMAWLRKPRSRGVTLHDRKKMFRAYIDEVMIMILEVVRTIYGDLLTQNAYKFIYIITFHVHPFPFVRQCIPLASISILTVVKIRDFIFRSMTGIMNTARPWRI